MKLYLYLNEWEVTKNAFMKKIQYHILIQSFPVSLPNTAENDVITLNVVTLNIEFTRVLTLGIETSQHHRLYYV